MARVYKARHSVLDTLHAVKVLSPSLVRDPNMRDRFLIEAKILAQLRHDNIPAVTDVIAQPGVAALVMAFIDGPRLDEYRESLSREPTIGEVQAIFGQLLGALHYAHSKEVIHRDIKPQNVIVARDSQGGLQPTLIDFGIAKVGGESFGSKRRRTRTGAKMGTVDYMSPEQVKGRKDIDERTDIFSIASTLYEFVTGELPFGANSEYDTMEKIVEGRSTPLRQLSPGVDPVIEACVIQGMSTDREVRFGSCAEFAELLEKAGTGFVPPSIETLSGISSTYDPNARRDSFGPEKPAFSPPPAAEREDSHPPRTNASLSKVPLVLFVAALVAAGAGAQLHSRGSTSPLETSHSTRALAPPIGPVTLEQPFSLDWFSRTEDYARLAAEIPKAELDRLLSRVTIEPRYIKSVERFASPVSRRKARKRVRSVMHILLSKSRVKKGRRFAKKHASVLYQVSQQYDVSVADLVSMLNAESRFGEVQGDFRVVPVFVANMAYLDASERAADYTVPGAMARIDNRKRIDKRRRYAARNLITVLKHADELGVDPLEITGSKSGAIGVTQFMPASLRFARDGDGDGKVDLSTVPDGVASTANYLVEHGYVRGDLDARKKAFTKYNPNREYVKAIVAYADRFESMAK